MNTYLIHDEWNDDPTVVEAADYGEAVRLWAEHTIAEWRTTGDYEEGDEDRVQPDSVEVVACGEVVRRKAADEVARLAGEVAELKASREALAELLEGRSAVLARVAHGLAEPLDDSGNPIDLPLAVYRTPWARELVAYRRRKG